MISLAATAQPGRTRRIGLCLCAAVLLNLVGCVSQGTYDKQIAETANLRQAIAQAQAELAELTQQVTVLQTANQRANNMTAELRAAIQHEQEAISLQQQRASDKLAALQTQLAHLVNDGRTLRRDMADAKQQNVSLRASVAQYKREMDEPHEDPARAAPAAVVPSAPQSAPTLDANQSGPAAQPAPPQRTALAAPAAPATPTETAPPPQPDPSAADDSWTGMILGWLSSLWSWIFP